MGLKNYDFSGMATKYNQKCSDGLTIRPGAFDDCNGIRVPLVWQHQHNSPDNVLGHAYLETREDGVYCYGSFNNSDQAQNAKELVKHGDIDKLSIYANHLQKKSHDVVHGLIREVSLVMAGANPGAVIDFPIIEHSDGEVETVFEEALIFHEDADSLLWHADKDDEDEDDKAEDKKPEDSEGEEKESEESKSEEKKSEESKDHNDDSNDDKDDEDEEENMKHADDEGGDTVQEIFNGMSDKQKEAVYAIITEIMDDGEDINHSDEGGNDTMGYNAFEDAANEQGQTLSHDDMATILSQAKSSGSTLKDYILQHADDYGITNIDYLFPDAKTLTSAPEFIQREQEWVGVVMSSTHKTPFSRIKTMFADITEDEARAKGYIKGSRKKEEVFGLLKRTTTPTTVYKKQKLDRDDAIDIVDFDVLAWLKQEMRVMLDEELARAFLVGDGRSAASDDKINEMNIRPIWTDDDLFTLKVQVAENVDRDVQAKATIRAIIKARKNYKGSGNPVMFVNEDYLTDMLLLEDGIGHLMYDTVEKLATTLRVKRIIPVPVFDGLSRTDSKGKEHKLVAIIVNLLDYNVGADKGGAVNFFDDFDIDYNQQKYLIETRCSGALIKPFSAMAVELVDGAVDPTFNWVPIDTGNYSATADPSALGWYEKDGDSFVATEDTSIDETKTYYKKVSL